MSKSIHIQKVPIFIFFRSDRRDLSKRPLKKTYKRDPLKGRIKEIRRDLMNFFHTSLSFSPIPQRAAKAGLEVPPLFVVEPLSSSYRCVAVCCRVLQCVAV